MNKQIYIVMYCAYDDCEACSAHSTHELAEEWIIATIAKFELKESQFFCKHGYSIVPLILDEPFTTVEGKRLVGSWEISIDKGKNYSPDDDWIVVKDSRVIGEEDFNVFCEGNHVRISSFISKEHAIAKAKEEYSKILKNRLSALKH